MKHFLILGFIFLAATSFATSPALRTINSIKAADCKSETGGTFKLDTETRSVEAQFAGLTDLTNNNFDMDEEKFVEVLEGYPDDEYDAIGALVVGIKVNAHTFGNASLLFQKGSQVLGEQKATAFFTDMNGDYETETMDCTITFK